MKAIRETWVLWKLSLAVMVLICFNTGVAQISYQVTDTGALHDGIFGCAMGLNNRGWTESMDGFLDASGNFRGRAVVNVPGLKIDLGTLGGPDSWINWGGINAQGTIVGYYCPTAPCGLINTYHGFVLSDGKFTSFAFPGHTHERRRA